MEFPTGKLNHGFRTELYWNLSNRIIVVVYYLPGYLQLHPKRTPGLCGFFLLSFYFNKTRGTHEISLFFDVCTQSLNVHTHVCTCYIIYEIFKNPLSKSLQFPVYDFNFIIISFWQLRFKQASFTEGSLLPEINQRYYSHRFLTLYSKHNKRIENIIIE